MEKTLPILAVEDESNVLKVYRSILGKEYDLRLAKTGAAGLEIFREIKEIPVLITDISMESQDAGLVLINEVGKINPATQIIIISGLHGKGSVALQTAKGKVSSLPKPVEVMYLRLAVKTAYARYFDYRMLYGVLDLVSAHPNL